MKVKTKDNEIYEVVNVGVRNISLTKHEHPVKCFICKNGQFYKHIPVRDCIAICDDNVWFDRRD